MSFLSEERIITKNRTPDDVRFCMMGLCSVEQILLLNLGCEAGEELVYQAVGYFDGMVQQLIRKILQEVVRLHRALLIYR